RRSPLSPDDLRRRLLWQESRPLGADGMSRARPNPIPTHRSDARPTHADLDILLGAQGVATYRRRKMVPVTVGADFG
ncbi:MAG: hypothetical protein P8X82_12040, partial [Gemmatimonadales bacterium]